MKKINETKLCSTSVGNDLAEKLDTSAIRISPLVRKIAKKYGIDYAKEPIKGGGPNGRIVKEDIIAYAETCSVKVNNVPLLSNIFDHLYNY